VLRVHVFLEFDYFVVANYKEEMECVLIRTTLDEFSVRSGFHAYPILFRRDRTDVQSEYAFE
jgi:hypothetical protein